MRKLLPVLLAALLSPFARAEPGAAVAASESQPPVAELSATDAIILGIVEGVTEYLPVSSTGHLIIATRFLHLESETPLRGGDGQPLWFRKPSAKHPHGVPLTLKLAADTFNVVIQFGAIAAVALLYWPQLVSMLRGLFGRDPAGLRLLVNIVIAFIPAAVAGLLLGERIEALFSVGAVILAQIVGAGLMLFAEAWRRRRAAAFATTSPPFNPPRRELGELTPKSAAGIGLLQCLALWPGMSRSMTTIVGGYFAGLEPRRAAEFSFLLGFATLSAATGYKGLRSGAAMIQVFGVPHVVLGCLVAAIVAAICVRFLVRWLTRHGLAIFAWYRLAVALVLAAVFYL